MRNGAKHGGVAGGIGGGGGGASINNGETAMYGQPWLMLWRNAGVSISVLSGVS